MDTLGERERIQREILRLRRAINVYAAHGNPEDVNRLRDEIGRLEGQLQQINQRERIAPERKG